jgi:thioredoxin-related protein
MTPIVIAALVVIAAVVIAAVLRRRQRVDAPTQASFEVPSQLDRNDFASPHVPWLVAVFSSATCQTCADVCRKAAVLASSDVAVQEVEYAGARDLHRKYRIEVVPIVVIADDRGIVRRSFTGPVTATDLWAAVAEARDPGAG